MGPFSFPLYPPILFPAGNFYLLKMAENTIITNPQHNAMINENVFIIEHIYL